jgi:hypothetical protein
VAREAAWEAALESAMAVAPDAPSSKELDATRGAQRAEFIRMVNEGYK